MRLPSFSPTVFFPTRRLARNAALVVIITLAAALLAACGEQTTSALEPAAPSTTQELSQVEVEELLRTMLQPEGPDAITDYLAGLPPAATVTEEQVRNRHQPWVMDTIQTRDYGTVQLKVYLLGASGEELLASVRVSSPGVRFHGLTVGMPANATRAALGGAQPLHTEVGSEAHLLTADGAPPAQVTLEFAGGELSAYTVHAYLD